MQAVAYYRVSTVKQGMTGLGMSAQVKAVRELAEKRGYKVTAEFREVESGRKRSRPALTEALAACRKLKSVLLIAKLDRLARNAAFLFSLRDGGVEFVCADMPDVNRLTVGVLALVAEDELERISQRTKAGLAESRRRAELAGKVWLPKHRENAPKVSRKGGEATRAAAIQRARAKHELISSVYSTTGSLAATARVLNSSEVPPPRKGLWTATSVRRVLQLAKGS